MKILVIDDKQEERNNAVAAVEAAGHEALVAKSLFEAKQLIIEADGVITDLYFPPRGDNQDYHNDYVKNPPPCGLLIAIAANWIGKQVVICSDGAGHGAAMSWIADSFHFMVQPVINEKLRQAGMERPEWYDGWGTLYQPDCPFALEGNKNWERAVVFLEQRTAENPRDKDLFEKVMDSKFFK